MGLHEKKLTQAGVDLPTRYGYRWIPTLLRNVGKDSWRRGGKVPKDIGYECGRGPSSISR